uniref:Uncharacterized protein n=1 Tax=Anguilla anguilla TaxID=7936 RepID=A0A0E9UVM2_ANGAN
MINNQGFFSSFS